MTDRTLALGAGPTGLHPVGPGPRAGRAGRGRDMRRAGAGHGRPLKRNRRAGTGRDTDHRAAAGRPRRWRGDEGTSPIELVILLPVVIMALFTSIQIAVYYLAKAEALAAAQQAVTVQRQYQAPNLAGYNAARNYLTSGGGDWLTGTSITVDVSDPTQVYATITGSAPSLLPFMNLRITVVAHGTVERPTP